ncbi:MAG: nitroreductase [Desulfobacterales bacterium]|nr:nitroreductase [Desulfobacterales bacterium]
MDLFTAIQERKSVRAYLDKPVSRVLIEKVFTCAGSAPSAINLQPWEFVATHGEEKDRLVRRLKAAHRERRVSCGPGTESPLPQKYTERGRRALTVMEPAVGRLNIAFNRFIEEGSCSFYGAPVAVIVTIDRLFPAIRYLDVGLSVAYLMLAAHAEGLATCPIGLILEYAEDISATLNISEDKRILLGISMGYEDPASPANQFHTDREELAEILTWYE